MEQIFDVISKEMLVFLISMVPVVELRGAIPFAIAFDIPWYFAYPLCVVGNMLPVPFIIAYLKPLFNFIRRSRYFVKIVEWLERRTMKKAETVLKYSSIALFAFVAVPLPGTGAWTGAMIAAVLGMRMKYALPAIFSGVVTAGFIVTFLSYHII